MSHFLLQPCSFHPLAPDLPTKELCHGTNRRSPGLGGDGAIFPRSVLQRSKGRGGGQTEKSAEEFFGFPFPIEVA